MIQSAHASDIIDLDHMFTFFCFLKMQDLRKKLRPGENILFMCW